MNKLNKLSSGLKFPYFSKFTKGNVNIELLKSSSIAFSIKIVGLISGYAFTFIVARFFGAETFGIFILSFTMLQIASILGRLGLDTALLRFTAEYTSQNKWDLFSGTYHKALKIIFPTCMFLSIVIFSSSSLISKYIFHKPSLTTSFQIVSIAVLPMVLVFVNSEVLRGIKKIKQYAFYQTAAPYMGASLLLCLFFYLSQGSYIPTSSYVVSIFFVAILSLFSIRNNFKFVPFSKDKVLEYKYILSISLPMLFVSSLSFIMGWTDSIMLGAFKSESAVGIYNGALKLSKLTSLNLLAVNAIAAPKFAELYGRGDMEGLQSIVKKSTKLIFFTSLPFVILFFFFPSFFLSLLGEEFTSGSMVLIFLTFGQFVNAISGSVGYILQMTGKQKILQYILLGSSIFNVLLNYFLIPKYGINGAAFASMVSIVTWNLLAIICIKYYLNISSIYIPFFSNSNPR